MGNSEIEKPDPSRRVARLPGIARIVAVFLVAITCAGCVGDYGPVAALRELPEASLIYPGAKVVQETSGPRQEGPLPPPYGAEYGHFLAVNATPDEVIAFYDRAFTSRGWTRSTQETYAGALGDAQWTKPGLWLSVWIDPADSSDLPSDLQRSYSGYQLSVRVFVHEDWPPDSPS